jgi:hypothetical protein
MRLRGSRNRIIAGIAGALLITAGATASFAAIPDSDDGEFHMCKADYSAFFGIWIDKQANESCPSGYTEKVWNQTGPTGPTGATGPTGPAGEAAAQPHVKVRQHLVSYSSGGGTVNYTFACPEGYEAISVGYHWQPGGSTGGQFRAERVTVNPDTQSPFGDFSTEYKVGGEFTPSPGQTQVQGDLHVRGVCMSNVISDAIEQP